MEVEKKLLAGGEQHFTAAEMQELAKSYRLLQEKAADGEMVRDKVIKELRSLAAVVLPSLTAETVLKMTEGLSFRQLDEMKNAFESKASEVLPLRPQLYRQSQPSDGSNNVYQNI